MSKFAASINKNMATVEKLIAKKNLSKKDQEELRMMLYGIQTALTSNIPFFRQMFQEEMDKIVVDTKAEIDTAMQHAATKSGIKALGLQFMQQSNRVTFKLLTAPRAYAYIRALNYEFTSNSGYTSLQNININN